jgi:hypothetical protein
LDRPVRGDDDRAVPRERHVASDRGEFVQRVGDQLTPIDRPLVRAERVGERVEVHLGDDQHVEAGSGDVRLVPPVEVQAQRLGGVADLIHERLTGRESFVHSFEFVHLVMCTRTYRGMNLVRRSLKTVHP